MLKLAGSVSILLGGFMLRQLKLQERRRYLEMLNALIHALQWISDTIRVSRTPLPDLFRRCSQVGQADVCLFFRSIVESLQAEDSLCNAWRTSVSHLHLSDRSQQFLLDVGQRLCGDEEAVLAGLSMAAEQLQQEQEELEQSRSQEEKRITALSLSAAALLVILFI